MMALPLIHSGGCENFCLILVELRWGERTEKQKTKQTKTNRQKKKDNQ